MAIKLFVCENPFQIMVTLILCQQFGNDDVIDILVTNRSSDMHIRAEQLKKISRFRNVFFIENRACNIKDNRFAYLYRQFKCEFLGCSLKEVRDLPYDYTDLYAIDVTCMTNYICHELQARSIMPAVHLYEEGFACYTDLYDKHLFGFHSGRNIVAGVCDKLHSRNNSLKLVKDLYLFEPNMLRWDCPFEIKQIYKPRIEENAELKNQLNEVFKYDNDAEVYMQQVIFFEDCIFQDKGDNRDFAVVADLAKQVGKENFLVKMHPRTSVNRFESVQINTIKKQGMPWEIVAMNMKQDDNRIFITVASSSVITYSLLFEKNYHSILLFKCIPGFANNVNPDVLDFLECYAKEHPQMLFIPETLDEVYEKIKQWMI